MSPNFESAKIWVEKKLREIYARLPNPIHAIVWQRPEQRTKEQFARVRMSLKVYRRADSGMRSQNLIARSTALARNSSFLNSNRRLLWLGLVIAPAFILSTTGSVFQFKEVVGEEFRIVEFLETELEDVEATPEIQRRLEERMLEAMVTGIRGSGSLRLIESAP